MMRGSDVVRFAGTVWGKILIVLTIVSVAGGIVAEVVSARTAYSAAEIARYEAQYAEISQKAESEGRRFLADEKAEEATNASLRRSSEAREADYKAQVEREKALYASIKERAEADLKKAEARVKEADSEFTRRQLEAEASSLEAETRQVKTGIEYTRKAIAACGYCKGRDSSCFATCSYQDSLKMYMGR